MKSRVPGEKAAAVPLFYGFIQLTIIPIYVIIGWKLGWSYAPASDPLWKVLRDSYQHHAADSGRTRSGGGEELREVDVEPENDSDLTGAEFAAASPASPADADRTI